MKLGDFLRLLLSQKVTLPEVTESIEAVTMTKQVVTKISEAVTIINQVVVTTK